MKKKSEKIFIILLLAIIAILCYFISITYAKYTRKLSGSDTATVAKFSVTAKDLNKEQNAEISLFNNIKEADTTSEESHVAADRIAPGTGGQFTTSLTNNSEVDVKAVLTVKETANASNVPIEYSIDGKTFEKAADFTKEVNLDYKGKTSGKSSEDVTIYWRWAFTDTDETALGEMETAPTVETQVSATFTQVD